MEPDSSGFFIVTQSKSCVVMEGLSATTLRVGSTAAPGDAWRAVFTGTLRPNFQIDGVWIWTWHQVFPSPDAPTTGDSFPFSAAISFDAAAEPVITLEEAVAFAFGSVLRRTSTSTQLPEVP